MEELNVYNYFLERGLLGVLLIINMGIIAYGWRQIQKLRDQIELMLKDHAKQVKALQEEKLEMQREHLDTLLLVKDEVTEVTNRVTTSMEALVVALTRHE